MWARLVGSSVMVAAASWLVGCHVGDGGGNPIPDGHASTATDTDTTAVDCRAVQNPGENPMRRLSRVEYGNTIYQLFGRSTDLRIGLDTLVADGKSAGFSNQASVISTSPLLASQYLENSEALANDHVDQFLREMPNCEIDAKSPACLTEVQAWIVSFGLRVFRRPLTEAEVVMHSDIYSQAAMESNSREGAKEVIATLLQSPYFLYRVEADEGSPVGGGLVNVSSWEMASRLSYMFWNTMPDDELFAAAAGDALKTPEQIEAQARRLLHTQRSRVAFRNFFSEWLNLDHVLSVRNNGKNLELYPDYNDGQPPELREETLEFFDYAIFEDGANLDTLFTAPYTRLNKFSAQYYGIENGPQGAQFETVALDPTRYAGFLTHAGHLMANSTTELSSPIHRGIFIRANVLCQPPPPPPPDVPPAPKVDRRKTTREQFAAHSDNATCAACHKMMDPIGLAFEHFDAMGRYRMSEWGKPIDARGTIFQRSDGPEEWAVEAEFSGVVELGKVLAESPRVKECFARQWFRFSMGRSESDDDFCSLASIDQEFARVNYDIRELLIAITQTPAFRYRQATGSDGGGEP